MGTFTITSLGLVTILEKAREMRIFNHRLSRSSVHHSGTTIIISLKVLFMFVFVLDVLRPGVSVVALAFRYISTLDAINSDLGTAPLLYSRDGLLMSLLVFVNHIKFVALMLNVIGRGGGAGCHCPDSGVVVGWSIRFVVGCVVVNLKGCNRILTRRLSALKRRIVKTSLSRKQMSDVGSGVTATFIVSTASRRSLSILPLGDISVIVITVNRGFKTSVHIITVLGRGRMGRVCTHTVSKIRGTMLRTFKLRGVLAPRRSTTQDLIRLLSFNAGVRAFQMSSRCCIIGFGIPRGFINCFIGRLGLSRRFGLGLVKLGHSGAVGGYLNVSLIRRGIMGRLPRSTGVHPSSMLIYCNGCDSFRGL